MRVWLCRYQNWSAFAWRSAEWFVRMVRDDCVFLQIVVFGVVRSPFGSFLQQAHPFLASISYTAHDQVCKAILCQNPAS